MFSTLPKNWMVNTEDRAGLYEVFTQSLSEMLELKRANTPTVEQLKNANPS